jgi:hypothetical protein
MASQQVTPLDERDAHSEVGGGTSDRHSGNAATDDDHARLGICHRSRRPCRVMETTPGVTETLESR